MNVSRAGLLMLKIVCLHCFIWIDRDKIRSVISDISD